MTDIKNTTDDKAFWPKPEQLKAFFLEQGRPEAVASTFARVISQNGPDNLTVVEHGLTEKELDGLLGMLGIKPDAIQVKTAMIQKLFTPEH